MRKLASVQVIDEIRPIKDADAIECAVVLGWQVVVKKGELKVGDKCVFFEIDSILPDKEIYRFLGEPRKDYNGYRLKTMKLRGQLSQGLVLPLELFNFEQDYEVGTDLTQELGIRKYEPPIPEEEGAKSSGGVWEIPKTDEDRYQSNPELVEQLKGKEYYASVKLDGTSMTVILNINEDNMPEVNVCGRNTCYMENTNNKYWKVAHNYDMANKMLAYYDATDKRLAFQGELIGPKIQANKMGMTENDLYIFNVWMADGKMPFEKCDLDTALQVVKDLGLQFVPIELEGTFNYEVDDLQALTELPYNKYFPNAKLTQNIEGLVFRSKDMKTSFKVVSNRFLLKGGE